MDAFPSPTFLYSDDSAGLRVFSMHHSSQEFLSAQHCCHTVYEVDTMLKTAVSLCHDQFPLWLQLCDVSLRTAEECNDYYVSFEYRKLVESVPRGAIWNRDSMRREHGLNAYEFREEIKQKSRGARMRKAWAIFLQREVIIRSYESIRELERINEIVKDAVLQARVKHEHTDYVVDIACTHEPDGALSLHVVTEPSTTDLESITKTRRLRGNFFSEPELLSILQQTTSGLLDAKAKVTHRQGIAHHGIKPSNMLQVSDGKYRLAGFQRTPEGSRAAGRRNFSQCGSVEFLSPEARLGEEVDWFAADVYSLGLAILLLGKLRLPINVALFTEGGADTQHRRSNTSRLNEEVRSDLQSLRYSERVRKVLRAMLSVDPKGRASAELVSEMLNTDSLCEEVANCDDQMTEDEATAEIQRLEQSSESNGPAMAHIYVRTALSCRSKSEFLHVKQWAQRGAKLHEDLFGKAHSATICAKLILSKILMANEKLQKAESTALECLRNMSREDDNSDFHKVYTVLTEISMKRSDFESAEKFALESVKVHERNGEENSLGAASTYNSLSTIYKETDQLCKSEQFLIKSIAIYERYSRANSPEAIVCYNNLAAVYIMQERLAEAEEFAVKGVRAEKRIYGEAHESLAASYTMLAKIYCSLGRLAEAEEHALKSLSIHQRSLASGSAYLPFDYNNLYIINKHLGRLQKAEEFAIRCFGIDSQFRNAEVQQCFEDLGLAYRPDSAVKYSCLAVIGQKTIANPAEVTLTLLKIQQDIYGYVQFDTAICLNNLSQIHLSHARLREAESYAKSSLTLMEQLCGDEHACTAAVCSNLSVICWMAGKMEDAKRLSEKAGRVLESTAGVTKCALAMLRDIRRTIVGAEAE